MTPETIPARRRILIVEDEPLVAILIEDTLVDLGCAVVGPLDSIERAMAVAQNEPLDGAFLDVNVYGQFVYPIAETLAARNIPFVFMTGYGEAGIDARYRSAPVLAKPFLTDAIEQLLQQYMGRSQTEGS